MEGKIGENETKITTLLAEVGTNEGGIAALTGKITTNENDIANDNATAYNVWELHASCSSSMVERLQRRN